MLNNLKSPEKLPECIDDTIKAAIVPPAKSIGNGFADILSLVFFPFSNAAEKIKIKQKYNLEQYEKQIIKKYNEIPEEKRVEPNFQVIASALEASKYSLDEKEIRNMYANLIANSINSDFSEIVHPSYSEVIKQLTPRDANNLSIFKGIKKWPIVKYAVYFTGSNSEYFISYSDVFLANTNYTDPVLSSVSRNDIINQSVSISNLQRLNTIEITYTEMMYTDSKDLYEHFKYTELYKSILKKHGSNTHLVKGIARLTPYGESLLTVCSD